MLGAWRAHGLDEVLREAWQRGIVLCGLSAGSLCWFTEALSAFHGDPLVVRGLGLLPYSNCVHYDARAGAARGVPLASSATACAPGYAADDGAALHFGGRDLRRVVSSRPGAPAYRVEPRRRGRRDAAARQLPRRPRCRQRGAPREPRDRDPRDGRRRLHDGAGQPGARRLRPVARPGAASRGVLFLPTASGDPTAQITAFHARFGGRARRRRTCRCSACHGDDAARSREIVLEQDVDLRRRRLDAQPAGDLARARARPACSREAWRRGDRARRTERRRDVLVRGRRDEVDRPADADRRARLAARLADRPRRRRAGAAAGVAGGGAFAARCPAAGPPTTASGCCSAGASSSASSAHARARPRCASTPSTASSCAGASSRTCWGATGLRARSSTTTCASCAASPASGAVTAPGRGGRRRRRPAPGRARPPSRTGG